MRKMIRMMLESVPHTVIEAPNGTVGVQLFRDQKPDLVITDILMPDKEGLETVREIRQIDPLARILAMSGSGTAEKPDFLRAAKEFGAAETLQKPFRRAELLAAVERALARMP